MQKKVFDLLYQIADIPFLSQHKDKIFVSHIFPFRFKLFWMPILDAIVDVAWKFSLFFLKKIM